MWLLIVPPSMLLDHDAKHDRDPSIPGTKEQCKRMARFSLSIFLGPGPPGRLLK
jgi:hypothetical protein